MDSLSKKIGNLGIHDIRNAARFAQNMIVQYEPYQVDIRRATNTDSWGPTPKHLSKVMRNRFQVPLYLMTEYILKRLVDHIATRPKNLYEKARKQYVNYGNEWRVVLKCLVLLEYMLLNVDVGNELDQVVNCILTHKHILTRDIMQYHVDFSNDGKMEVHERGIKKKCEQILQYVEDLNYLKRERVKQKKNTAKIHQAGTATNVAAGASYNDNQITTDSYGTSSTNSYDDDFDDFEEYEVAQKKQQEHRQRRSSALEQQRRQRREMLREQIRSSEQQRKAPQSKTEQPSVDLLDFDDVPSAPSGNLQAQKDDDEDEDEFGDFQSESSPQPTTASAPPAIASSNMNDLLDWDGLANTSNNTSTVPTTPAANNSNPSTSDKKDAFADLFSYSKSHV